MSAIWSILVVKYLNFEQKLSIWTAHHTFTESKHPEATKVHVMFCPCRGAIKQLSLHGLYMIIQSNP